MLESRYFNFHLLNSRGSLFLSRCRVWLCWRACTLGGIWWLAHWNSHRVGAGWVGIRKAAKLMWQDKIELLIFQKSHRLSCLEIGPLGELLTQRDSCKHLFCVVAPCLLFEAIVEVFVHVLASIVIPWLRVVVKVILVDFR